MRGRWRDYNEDRAVKMARINAPIVAQDRNQGRGQSQGWGRGRSLTPE
jgi:hypothetical protein